MLAKSLKQEEFIRRCVQLAMSIMAFKKGLSELITKTGLLEDFSQSIYVAAFEACSRLDLTDANRLKGYVERSIRSFLQDYCIVEEENSFVLQETPLGYNVKN